MENKDWLIKEDNICPSTGELCLDECCPPGSICNLRNYSMSSEGVTFISNDEAAFGYTCKICDEVEAISIWETPFGICKNCLSILKDVIKERNENR